MFIYIVFLILLLDHSKTLNAENTDYFHNINSKSCFVEEWNKVETEPSIKLFDDISLNSTGNNTYVVAPTLIGAYAFDRNITVTFTAADSYFGKKVYCQYFDCRRTLINKPSLTIISKEYVAICPRRYGAHFIALSESVNVTEPLVKMIPIQNRTEKKKYNYLSVCVKEIMNSKRHFLYVAEFIEYYRLQGASFFTFYIGNVSSYDRFLYDDYMRTGELETIRIMPDSIPSSGFFFNDCQLRNINVSKWTAIVDFSEFAEVTWENPNPLKSVLTKSQDISKFEMKAQLFNCSVSEFVSIYISDDMTFGEMRLPACITTNGKLYDTNSVIIQTNMEPNNTKFSNSSEIILNTYKAVHNANSFTKIKNYPSEIISQLTNNVVQRVNYIYDVKEETCDKIRWTRYRHGLPTKCWNELVDKKLVRTWSFVTHNKWKFRKIKM